MSWRIAMLAGTTAVAMITAAHLWHQLRIERELSGQLFDRVTELETKLARQSQLAAVVPIPSSLPAQVAEPQDSGAQMPTIPISEAPGSNRSPSLNLRELLKDPDYREARRAQIRMQLPLAYPDLAKELGFSPAEADAFFDLMVRQQMDRMLLAPGADDSDDVRQQAQREVAELARTSQSEVADLLGPARNQAWQDYQKTLGSRLQVGQLRTMLSTAGYPLTDAQAAPLLATISSEQQRLSEEARLRTYPGDPRGQMDIAEESLKATEESNQRILDAAPAYLNSQQLEALKSWMAQQLNMSRAMARARRAELESGGTSPTTSP